jgi:hypothetical protein
MASDMMKRNLIVQALLKEFEDIKPKDVWDARAPPDHEPSSNLVRSLAIYTA